MIRYKFDVLEALKNKGYSTYKLRHDKLIGEASIQALRHNKPVGLEVIGTVCSLLNLQIGDIVEYVPEDKE